MGDNDPLDNPDLNIKDHFKSFIKTKKIEELIAYDNKLFSEVRNLESEKHVLVTQNYKKFVSATETINTIKTSLVGFEKDLIILQGKVQNLVSNFTSINSSIDGKLKETEEVYKIKKDLKRLKFINDLPNILEKQLSEYEKSKDIKTLDKSLNYYQKCRDFIKIHKDNTLVKDIYSRTNSLIYNYRALILNEMQVPDFNEFELEKFEICLGLLVKIEDDKEELKKTFISRYQYIISSKYDSLFSSKEGINEIDFAVYSKIYDNYEFAINENDFLFYEEQIKEGKADANIAQGSGININPNKTSSSINISKLSSKFFKKGTFIWMCKKISEDVLNKLLLQAYQSYVKLFGKSSTDNLNELLKHSVTVFYNKISGDLGRNKYSTVLELDPIFFREGLLCFYKSGLIELFEKFNDAQINASSLKNDILTHNQSLLQDYLCNLHCTLIASLCSEVKLRLDIIIPSSSSSSVQSIDSFKHFNKAIYTTHVASFFVPYQAIISTYSQKLSSLSLDNFNNENEVKREDTYITYSKQLLAIIGISIMILQSSNISKFNCNKYSRFFLSNHNEENISAYKSIITQLLSPASYEKIYFFIFFAKHINNTTTLKGIIDKLFKSFPSFKTNKAAGNDLRSFIEKELIETFHYLYDSIIQKADHFILIKIKELFHDINWNAVDQSPVTFRLPLKNLCYELYQLKLDLMDVLGDEAKVFQETKMSAISDSLNPNFVRKNKSIVQIEMEKLQIRRLSIYGEHAESPQMIIYIIAKIFLKMMNEFIKLKKFSMFSYQQIQIDLCFIHSFFRENLVVVDVDNILDGFNNEIMKNCAFNTNATSSEIANNQFNEGLIGDMIKIHSKEFKDLIKKTQYGRDQ